MKVKDYCAIRWGRQRRGRIKQLRRRECTGLDTETTKGKAFLIACSDGRTTWVKSFEDCLSFLTHRNLRGKLNFFFNLDYDVQAILKHVDPESWYTLYRTGSQKWGTYTFVWLPKKVFKIRDKNRTYAFYDIQQFYRRSLDSAARKFLGKGKIEIEVERFDNPSWVKEHREEIERYCLNDAVLTKELAERMQDLFLRAGADFSRPMSTGSLAMRYLSMHTNIPRAFDCEWQEYAYRSYHGGRFECFKRGTFDKVYIYDINSAYPYQISKLPDLRAGEWVKEKDIPDDAELGFVRAKLRLPERYIEPLPFEHHGLIVFPRFRDDEYFLTLDEFRFVESRNLASAEILDGWFFIPEADVHPFAILEDMYKQRLKLKKEGDEREYVFKTLMSSVYGKFLEINRGWKWCDLNDPEAVTWEERDGKVYGKKPCWVAGRFFNPVYASTITARTRLQLLEQMLRHEDDIVATFTDSVFSLRPIPSDVDKLGGWTLKAKGRMVLIATGVYTIETETGYYTRTRGFKPFSRVLETGDMKEDEKEERKMINFFEVLKAHPKAKSLKFVWKHAVKLGELLAHHYLYSREDFNVLLELRKLCDLNSDEKREWKGRFYNCEDVLEQVIDSKPLDLVIAA